MQDTGNLRTKKEQWKRDEKASQLQFKRKRKKFIKNSKIAIKAIGVLFFNIISNLKITCIRFFGFLKTYLQIAIYSIKKFPNRIQKNKEQKTAQKLVQKFETHSKETLKSQLEIQAVLEELESTPYHAIEDLDNQPQLHCQDGVEPAQESLEVQKTLNNDFSIVQTKEKKTPFKEKFQNILTNTAEFNKKRRKILVPIGIVSLCLAVGVYIASFYTIGLNVYVDNDIVARTSDQEKFEEYILQFDEKFSQQIQEPYETNLNFYYEFSLVPKAELNQFDGLENYLLEKNREVERMYVLKVDGEMIGGNVDKQKLEEMLEGIKSLYATGQEGETVEFVEPIEVIEQYSKVDNHKSIEELKEILLSKSKPIADHTVKKGETLSKIAKTYGLTTKDLLSLNSGLQENQLQVGSTLVISQEQPMLSVKTVRTNTVAQAIEYATQTELSSDMYTNQTKVKSEGELGEALVTEQVVLINNVETQRILLNSKVTKEPVDEVIIKGTKELPSSTATGTLRMPVSGTVSSRFGSRGRNSHTGLDIAAPTGTPVYAADGGKVMFAGWSGGYGNIIKIDHGNGMQTWYAHLSSIGVRAGATVAKGSKIGAVGSTGNSTGSHLHIEVRIDGEAVNPSNYLD